MKNLKLVVIMSFLITIVFSPNQAAADDVGISGYNANMFRPSIDGTGVVNAVGSKSLEKWQATGGFTINFAKQTLRRNNLNPSPISDPITSQLMGDYMFAVGLPYSFTTGLDTLIYFFERGQNYGTSSRFNEAAVGDIRWSLKWQALDGEKGPGLALLSQFYVPTGSRSKFTGNGNVSEELRLVIDKTFEQIVLVANLGYLITPKRNFVNNVYDDQFLFALGMEMPFVASGFGAFAEINGAMMPAHPQKKYLPLETLVGIKKHWDKGWDLTCGLGVAMPGVKAMGTPDYHFFGGIRYTSPVKAKEPHVSSEPTHIKKVIHFDTDRSDIKPYETVIVDEVADILRAHSNMTVLISGHTDWVGTSIYNQGLSERRANSVRKHLIEKGVLPGQIEIDWFGKERPMADNQTEEGRAKNRRAEMDAVVLEIM